MVRLSESGEKVAGSGEASSRAGLEVGVELNSRKEGLWLTDFARSMHSIAERISLNR